MRRALAVFAAATATAACSLLVDTNGLSAGEAPAPDAAEATAPLADAPAGDAPISPDAPLVVGTAYRDAVMSDAPFAYFRFAEVPGAPAADESGHGRSGNYLGDFTLGVPSIVRGSDAFGLGLRPQGGVVVASMDFDMSGTKSFTIEIWFSPDLVDDAFRYLYCREIPGDTTRRGIGLFVHKTSVSFERHENGVANGVYAGATDVLAVGKVAHAVATYDGAKMILYVNGVQTGSNPDPRSITSFDRPTYVGTTAPGYGGFSGVIDEFAFYDKALGPDRVDAHYRAGKP